MSKFNLNKHTKRVKLLITFGCCCIFVIYGLALAIPTTTIFDVAFLVQAEVAYISYGFTVDGVFYTIGTLSNGYLFKYVDRRKVLIYALFVASIRLATIPIVRNLAIYYIACAFQGYNASVFDVAVNAWILDLWREKCNTYMQSLHFSGALGMATGPLILAYFVGLNPELNEGSVTTGQLHPFEIIIQVNQTSDPVELTDVPIGRFSIPFILAGFMGASSAFFQIWLYFMEERAIASHGFSGGQKDESYSEEIQVGQLEQNDEKVEKTEEQSKPPQSKLILILAAIILFIYLGMELNTFSFVTAYIVYFGYSVKTGATQALILTSAFALFRFIAIFSSKKLTAISLIFIHLTLLFVGCIILLFFSTVSLTWISLGLFIFGGGSSIFLPSLFSMIECLTSLDNTSIGILLFCGSLASACYPIFMPTLLEIDPMFYVYSNITSLILVALFIFILLIKFGGHNMPLLKPPKVRVISM